MAPVHRGEREEETGSERERQRQRKKRDKDAAIERERERDDSQGLLGKNTITPKHIKNRLSIVVFIELSYRAGGTEEWVLI